MALRSPEPSVFGQTAASDTLQGTDIQPLPSTVPEWTRVLPAPQYLSPGTLEAPPTFAIKLRPTTTQETDI